MPLSLLNVFSIVVIFLKEKLKCHKEIVPPPLINKERWYNMLSDDRVAPQTE